VEGFWLVQRSTATNVSQLIFGKPFGEVKELATKHKAECPDRKEKPLRAELMGAVERQRPAESAVEMK
jgi:hypothetical protein